MTSSLVRFLLLPVLALATGASGLHGQTGAAVSPDHATFYTEPNFQGEALTVEAGASIESLDRMMRANQTPWTAAISSVRLGGAATATVFSAAGFSGERLEITGSIADLYAASRGRDGNASWDRAIASLAVTSPQRTTVAPTGPPMRQAPPPPAVVIVPAPRPPPPVVLRSPRPRLDRRAAEAIVQRAFREVLDRPADPEGLRTYCDRLMYEGWNERQIVEQLQRSGEARAISADAAIRKIYREVLGRDPDANGLAHYRAKWRQGWTQGQIRADLQRSTEGRDGKIRAAIIRAYREVLGREPDPEGFAVYERAMRERGYTERDVKRALMSGDEYRQRRAKSR